MKKRELSVNIKMQSKGLADEERKILREAVRKINAKRKRDNAPRLLYKIKLR